MATSKAKTKEKVEDDLSADLQSVDIHDRITEAYFGELGTPMMHKTRERVHWICEKVYGSKVLDVGCSQGIVPILLAREGKKVTGLDLAEKSILQAKVYLEQESKNVQDKVSFIHGDFLQHGFDKEQFDTIILGELLEHLVDPAPFIKSAASLVKAGGRIIVTVPFGINDFPDHKQTYYFTGPYELICDEFTLEETRLFGKWIGFIARPKSRADRDVSTSFDLELLREVEHAFFGIERRLTDQNVLLRKQLKKIETRANEASAKYRGEIQALESDFKSMSERHSLLQKRFVDQESLNKELASRIQNIRKSHNAETEEKSRQAAQLINLEAVNKERLRVIDEMLEKCDDLTKKIGILESSLADAKESLNKKNKEGQKAGREALQYKLEAQKRAFERRVDDLKSSLTYQIGLCFRNASKSPRGLLKLPVELLKVWRQARRATPTMSVQPGPAFKLREKNAGEGWVDLSESPLWQTVAVSGEDDLAVFGRIKLRPDTDEETRCGLVRIEFLDSKNRPIKGEYPRTNYSKRVGHYKYFYFHPGEEGELFRIRPLPDARAVRLGLQSWEYGGLVSVSNELKIERVEKDQSPQSRGPKKAVVRSEAAERFRRECATAGWLDPDEIPESGQPKILSIMDEFTTGCFAPDCYLVQPRPENWEPLSDLVKPDLIFVESAWKGNGGTWQYRVGSYSNKPGRELEEIGEYSRETGIPMIFWNKEDPVHHDKFLETASLAHMIFTTDARMIPEYQKKTGNDRVFALPFAAQPALHRPQALSGRHERACFAGSWYGDRHSERSRDMAWLLKAVQPFGLDIYDRNYGTGNFNFPEEYRENVRGGLPYSELCCTYGRYRLFVNVNSVSESPTMFSRRVFELLACGTPVVSTYARGIEELLGTDAVWMVENEKQAAEAVDALLHDDNVWRRRSLAGIRNVFSSHTYRHRLAEIYEKLGLALPGALNPRVILVAHAHSQEDCDRLADFRTSQQGVEFDLKVYMDRELAAESRLLSPVQVRSDANAHGVEIVDALKQSPDTLIGWIDPQAEYDSGYLQDLINATRFAPEAAVWSKAVSGDEFCADQQGHAYSCLFRANDALSKVLRAHPAVSPPSALADNVYCIDREAFKPRP